MRSAKPNANSMHMNAQEHNKDIVRRFIDKACNKEDDKIIDEVFNYRIKLPMKSL